MCQRVGNLAYKQELPEELTRVHLVFHVSQLRKCLKLPNEQVPIEALDIQDNLEYKEHPIQILDRAEKETRSTTIPTCKVQWSNHTEREATWEKELELWMLYPTSLKGMSHLKSQDEIPMRGEEYNNPGFPITKNPNLKFFLTKPMHGNCAYQKPPVQLHKQNTNQHG